MVLGSKGSNQKEKIHFFQQVPSWNVHVFRMGLPWRKKPRGLASLVKPRGPPTIFSEASLDAAQTLLAGMLAEVKAVWSLSHFSKIHFWKGQTVSASILNGIQVYIVVDGYPIGNPEWNIYQIEGPIWRTLDGEVFFSGVCRCKRCVLLDLLFVVRDWQAKNLNWHLECWLHSWNLAVLLRWCFCCCCCGAGAAADGAGGGGEPPLLVIVLCRQSA